MLIRVLWCGGLLLAAGLVAASTPPPRDGDRRPTDARAVAHRVWAATDIVLEQHVDAPARQQMLLGSVKALLRQAADKDRPALNLGARVSRVSTEEQFAALLEEFWPRVAGDKGRLPEGEGLDEIALRGLLPAGERDEEGYLSAEQVKGVEQIAGNRYVGTGIQIRMDQKEELTQIVVPFPGGPARKAGARPGDLIVEVDGVSMKGVNLMKVVKKIQGEEGTPVTLTVRQPGAKETRVLKMVRSIVPFAAVLGFRRTGEESWSFKVDGQTAVGYLRITDLRSSTLLELKKLEPLVRAEGVRGLVLDLRFTRGLDVGHAALVADAFLDGGLLWRVRDAHGRVKDYPADRDCLFRDWPMAVLVSQHTGATAGAVAAALQDNGRASVVGTGSEGKPFVKTLIHLPGGGGALQLPTGVVERAGRGGERPKVAGVLVRPDQEVALDRKRMEDVLVWFSQQDSPEPDTKAKPPEDPQLTRAVSVVRAALEKKER